MLRVFLWESSVPPSISLVSPLVAYLGRGHRHGPSEGGSGGSLATTSHGSCPPGVPSSNSVVLPGKFITSYGSVTDPLMALLKREAFTWSRRHPSTGVLALNFSKRFTVDYDVSGVGFGAVLHQGTVLSVGQLPYTMPSCWRMNVSSLALWGRAFTVRAGPLEPQVYTRPAPDDIPTTHVCDQAVWLGHHHRVLPWEAVVDALSRCDEDNLAGWAISCRRARSPGG